MPRVSVVIPVRNGAKFIRQTIESVLQQTFQDFEIIVIDDGSTDRTLDVVSAFKNSKIKTFSYSNSGLAASRNRGFQHATGDFIAFLDADDLWTPDKLEAQLKVLGKNPKAAVAYSWTDLINEAGENVGVGNRPLHQGNVYKNLLMGNFLYHGSNPLIRRAALEAVGGFDAKFAGVEDWDLYLRLAATYDFAVVRRPQILYRLSQNSMSTDILAMAEGSLKAVLRAFERAPRSFQRLKKQAVFNRFYHFADKFIDNGFVWNQKDLLTLRFFYRYIVTNPYFLFLHPWAMLAICLKLAVAVLLPNAQAQKVIGLLKSLRKKCTQLPSVLEHRVASRIFSRNPLLFERLIRYFHGQFKPPYLKNHLVLIRTGELGDVLMCSAVVREIKRRNPKCRITFVTKYPEVLRHNPYIDQCIPIEEASERLPRGGIYLNYELYIPPSLHLIQYLGARVGLKNVPHELSCFVDPGLREYFSHKFSDLPRPWVVVHRRAGEWTPNKNWPDSYWDQLIPLICRNASVIELGTQTAGTLFSEKNYLSLAGKTSIEEMAAIISLCDLLVGPVSGPMHIAKAVGIPSVIICGGYEEPLGSSYLGNVNLHYACDCSPCWLRTACPYDLKCLKEISVEAVSGSIQKILEKKSSVQTSRVG